MNARIVGWYMVAWCAAVGTGACAPGEADPSTLVTRRDSADVTIVESSQPLWPEAGSWTLWPTPEVAIGSSSPGPPESSAASPLILFERIQDILVLSDGRIVVGHGGSPHIMVFDHNGRRLAELVQDGEGPGEVQRVVDLHGCGDDRLVVVGRSRYLFVDKEGELMRQLPAVPGEVVGVSTDCRHLLVQRRVGSPPLDEVGLLRDSFAWVDPDVGVVHQIAELGLVEAWTRRFWGGVRSWIMPWGTSRTFALRGDTLVAGYGRTPQLYAYDRRGTLHAIIRWRGSPDPITRRDRNHYEALRSQWMDERSGDATALSEARVQFPPLRDYPAIPEDKPLFDKVLVDDEGNIWLRRFRAGSFGLFDLRLRDIQWSYEVWTIFDATGRWMGDLRLPRRYELKAVARERLYGIALGDLDVQTVHVLRLEKPHGSR